MIKNKTLKYRGKDLSMLFMNNNLEYYSGNNLLYRQTCPYRITSDSTLESYQGLPEYNFNVLFIPVSNANDIAELPLTYSTAGIWYNNQYINAWRTITYCDDDAFSLNVIHTGSAAHGQNQRATIRNTTNRKYTEVNQNWYYAVAGYQVDGSYSSKIIHLPSDATSFDVVLNKYLCFLGSECNEWTETGREQTGYTSATNRTYYYYIPNEKQDWLSSSYLLGNYQSSNESKCLLSTLRIVESISATNTTARQTLHINTTANSTNAVKYQTLLYCQSTVSSMQGYKPNMYVQTKDTRTPRIILILEPKYSKFIYWGFEPDDVSVRTVVNYEYTDQTRTSKKVNINFNSLNFATVKTIKNKLNYTLYNKSVNDYQTNSKVPIAVYIAIPVKYADKFNINIDSYYKTTTDPTGIIKDGSMKCKFNKLEYMLYYMHISTMTSLSKITLEEKTDNA